jgi:FtsH-binding integral membrane protein
MNAAEFQANTPYGRFGTLAIDAPVDVRRSFIRKTYVHLAAAIYTFVALEWLLFSVGFDEWLMPMLSQSRWSWLVVLGAFVAVSYIADSWARSSTSLAMQYAGLFLYVLAEAVIFVPLLAIASGQTITLQGFGTVDIIPAAGVTTLLMFGGLTAMVFLTKKDFSFLGGMLGMSMFAAMALILVSILFGFNLGIWFCWLMVVAASGYILYYTSNVLHHYRTEQYVAASLALFASVALLFWYVLRIFMASRD